MLVLSVCACGLVAQRGSEKNDIGALVVVVVIGGGVVVVVVVVVRYETGLGGLTATPVVTNAVEVDPRHR